MKHATFWVNPLYCGNRVFDLNNTVINRDNCMYFNWLMREEFRRIGIELATQDIHPIEDSCFTIYSDFPQKIPNHFSVNTSYLLIWESEIIKPDNFKRSNHEKFRKIFTWDDRLVDGVRYFKINFSQPLVAVKQQQTFADRKFLAMVSGNKRNRDHRELYSKRVELIRWYESNHPDQFDLYGMGWEHYRFEGPKPIRALNRLTWLTSALSEKYPSFRGKVNAKHELLSKYRFCVSYENGRDIPGYITEKIIDPMIAGCVPIYWGAPNIGNYVPDDCFIDRRRFGTLQELHDFLEGIDERSFSKYQERIGDYLSGVANDHFGPLKNVDNIVKAIAVDL